MGFLHEHKLSHEKDFGALLTRGKTTTSFPLRFLYIVEKSERPTFQIAISVSKKRFHHAVDRNLIKRRIREGIRHCFSQNNFEHLSIQILVVYCGNTHCSQMQLEKQIASFFQTISNYANHI